MNICPELNRRLAARPILAAAVIKSAEHAAPLARALLAGGLEVMEVTFRNPHAAECIRRIRAELPAMLVGAGTILTPAQMDEARAAGAAFGLSPGFSPTTVRAAVERDFPFIPGVLSPGEMEQSLEAGCPLVKFFPAVATGGPAFLKSIAAPYLHTPLRIIPLGGINGQNLGDYLNLPLVMAVGGSWLTDSQLADAGCWDEITDLTRQAVEAAARARRS
jgi:2-dehydro-3-deoxyphosphogluconate aldolase/(4S)-4-hydroxy-2-oxoglutarate aldolase